MKKQLVQATTQTNTQMLFAEMTFTLCYQQKRPGCASRYDKEHWRVLQDWELINWTNFTVSSRAFFKKKKRFYFFIFREGKRGRKRGKQCVVDSCVFPTGDLAHNLGMYPDRKSIRWPFDLQVGTRPLSHTSQDSWSTFLNDSGFFFKLPVGGSEKYEDY